MSGPLNLGNYAIRSDDTADVLYIEHPNGSVTIDGGALTAPSAIIGSSSEVSDLTGTNLSIDGSGVLNATDSDTQPVASGTSATASGDGTATTFSLSHSLGTTPSQANVQPTSSAANGDFHVSAKTSSAVDVTYSSAPSSGTDNLTYDLVLIE